MEPCEQCREVFNTLQFCVVFHTTPLNVQNFMCWEFSGVWCNKVKGNICLVVLFYSMACNLAFKLIWWCFISCFAFMWDPRQTPVSYIRVKLLSLHTMPTHPPGDRCYLGLKCKRPVPERSLRLVSLPPSVLQLFAGRRKEPKNKSQPARVH